MTYLCKILRSVACSLYNIEIFLPFPVRKMGTNALAYSYLRYGVTIVMGCSLFWRAKIDSLLRGILKSVSFDRPDVSSACIFQELRLPSFLGLFMETVVLRHFWNFSFIMAYIAQLPMRPSLRFQMPGIRTKYGERTRVYCVSQIFNSLPKSFQFITSRQELRRLSVSTRL